MDNQNGNFNNYNDYNDCNNCNRNNNNGQQTIYGLIILILVCVAGYLYAQNLHLQKEVDHYKYYFDDDYSDSDDDSILSQILKPFTGSSDSDDGWIADDSNSLKISTPWGNYSW